MATESIDPRRLLIQVAKVLKRLKIPYFVTGGIAVLLWGRPRFTADIDIVIELPRDKVFTLEKALLVLTKAGFVDKEMIEHALDHEGEFNFIDPTSGVKVDFWILKRDQYDRERLSRRIPRKISGTTVHFTSPEDLILIKLIWHKKSGSDRQWEDVLSIIKISGRKLDKKYLQKWSRELGVLMFLRKAYKKVQN